MSCFDFEGYILSKISKEEVINALNILEVAFEH